MLSIISISVFSLLLLLLLRLGGFVGIVLVLFAWVVLLLDSCCVGLLACWVWILITWPFGLVVSIAYDCDVCAVCLFKFFLFYVLLLLLILRVGLGVGVCVFRCVLIWGGCGFGDL